MLIELPLFVHTFWESCILNYVLLSCLPFYINFVFIASLSLYFDF